MIVQCDSCKAKFNLADDKVTEKGLKVRCSKCKTVFVAKRSQGDSAPGISSAPAGPPASPAPPPAAKPGAAPSGADPFSDFTFSDDLDFDSKENTAPAAPISTERAPATPAHQDYAPEPIASPVKAAKAAPPPAEADQFNFANEDFAAPEPPPPPPPAPKKTAAPKPAPSQAKPPKSAGSGEDMEFGDFNFDEESFAEPESPAAKPAPAKAPPAKAPPAKAPPSKAPPAEEEMGSASFSDEMPSFSPGKGAAPAGPDDDEGYGDFHFDAEGSISTDSAEAGPADDLGGFVRSPTSRAPVRDDLEASLDTDTEAEPTPASRPAAAAAPANAPAKPVIRHAPRERNLTPWIFLGVMVLILLGLAGGIVFLHASKLFTFQDWTSGNFAKLKAIPQVQELMIRMGWMEPPDTGSVEVMGRSNEDAFVIQREGINILVVKGTVRNTFRKPKSQLQVEVSLYDENRNLLAQKKVYGDVTFTHEELRTLPLEDIEGFMNTGAGRNLRNLVVQKGEMREFMAVFYPVPPDVKQWDAKVVGYEDAEGAGAQTQEETKGQ